MGCFREEGHGQRTGEIEFCPEDWEPWRNLRREHRGSSVEGTRALTSPATDQLEPGLSHYSSPAGLLFCRQGHHLWPSMADKPVGRLGRGYVLLAKGTQSLSL